MMFYPMEKPKRSYTIQSIIQTIVLLGIFYVIHEVHSTAKVLLILGMLFSSICRSFTSIPRIINMNHSNPNTDAFSLSLWLILAFLGDVLGILFVQYLMGAGLHWNYSFMAYMVLFLGITFLHHFFVD